MTERIIDAVTKRPKADPNNRKARRLALHLANAEAGRDLTYHKPCTLPGDDSIQGIRNDGDQA